MASARRQLGWGFWERWSLATSLGLFVAWAVITPVMLFTPFISFFFFDVYAWLLLDVPVIAGNDAVFGAMFGAPISGAVGVTQWVVLRRLIPHPGWWVLASFVGYTVGTAVGWYMGVAPTGDPVGQAASGAVIGATFGASVGTLVRVTKRLALRRQVSQPVWWALASIMNWTVVAAVGWATGFTLGNYESSGEVGNNVVFGGVVGAITGMALTWLLRQAVSERYLEQRGILDPPEQHGAEEAQADQLENAAPKDSSEGR